MIRVTYRQAGEERSVSVTGHAGYAEHGKDIVCAGVTAVTYALALFLEKLDEGAKLRLDPGDAHIVCRRGDRAAAAFDMAVCGYLAIANSYPQYVEVILPDRG